MACKISVNAKVKQAEDELIHRHNVQLKTLFRLFESMSVYYFCFVKKGKAQSSTLWTTLTKFSDLGSCSVFRSWLVHSHCQEKPPAADFKAL